MELTLKIVVALILCVGIVSSTGCVTTGTSGGSSISVKQFGKARDGTPVDIYTLVNANGLKTRITNYGGIVVDLHVPDRSGKLGDIVLGYDRLDDYIKNNPYFGCLVGRYGNRIAKGKFALNGKEYTLATNNDANHLHAGATS